MLSSRQVTISRQTRKTRVVICSSAEDERNVVHLPLVVGQVELIQHRHGVFGPGAA